MSQNGSLMAGEDEEFVRWVIYVMIAWIIATVAAGALLILLQDVLSGVFASAAFL
ncbi:hypothetical protein ACFQGT_15635 [Natrialbaceae archaeon GCM10025810]|uniref:hypothetical protein n=1 Tax=Halovalidus salilacus TaxID=3075124 RepID=UPI0036198FDB